MEDGDDDNVDHSTYMLLFVMNRVGVFLQRRPLKARVRHQIAQCTCYIDKGKGERRRGFAFPCHQIRSSIEEDGEDVFNVDHSPYMLLFVMNRVGLFLQRRPLKARVWHQIAQCTCYIDKGKGERRRGFTFPCVQIRSSIEEDREDDYNVDHSTYMFFMNRSGVFLGILHSSDDADTCAEKMAQWIGEDKEATGP